MVNRMEFLQTFLPVMLYLVVIILVIVLIVLGIKAIETLDRVNRIANDVEKKLTSLNGVFSIIDLITDKISSASDIVITTISNAICKIFKRKRKESDLDGEEERNG